jgi:ElaB/YqjD/DUF883 family membrane-anchored ribosome-binding protein
MFHCEAGEAFPLENQERHIMNRKSENETEHPPVEKLLRDLKEVVQDGEELLKSGAVELSEAGGAMRERLVEAMESATDMGRRLRVRAVNGAKVTDKLIRENPYQSAGIAFGVGLLIGVLVSRRNG